MRTPISGLTPLHYALQLLRPAIVTALLDLGADAMLSFPADSSTALHHIARQCFSSMIDAPITVGMYRATQSTEPNHTSACASLWRRFLAAGVDVDAKDSKGDPALFWYLRQTAWPRAGSTPSAGTHGGGVGAREGGLASTHRQVPMLGAMPTVKPGQSTHATEDTPPHVTHFEAFFGDANLMARNNKGETALHVVANSQHRLPEWENAVFGFLVAKGLDPLAEDAAGRSSLDVAAEGGKEGLLGMFRGRAAGGNESGK